MDALQDILLKVLVDAQRFKARVIYLFANDNVANAMLESVLRQTAARYPNLRHDHIFGFVSSIAVAEAKIVEQRERLGPDAIIVVRFWSEAPTSWINELDVLRLTRRMGPLAIMGMGRTTQPNGSTTMLTTLHAKSTYAGRALVSIAGNANHCPGIYVDGVDFSYRVRERVGHAAFATAATVGVAAIAGPVIAPLFASSVIGSWGISHFLGAKLVSGAAGAVAGEKAAQMLSLAQSPKEEGELATWKGGPDAILKASDFIRGGVLGGFDTRPSHV